MVPILANENLHSAIVSGLRDAGCDVTYVPEIGMGGHPDHEILERAEHDGRVVISGDKDFGGLIEFGPLWGRGKVILLRYRLLSIDRATRDILDALSREESILRAPAPVVIVLSEGRRRIHRPSPRP